MKGGGGAESLEDLEPQGIRAVALFLTDGRVALFPGSPLSQASPDSSPTRGEPFASPFMGEVPPQGAEGVNPCD